jgi:hypothetical protein
VDGARFDSAPGTSAGGRAARHSDMTGSETDRERGEKRGLVSTDDVDAGDADADANDDAED